MYWIEIRPGVWGWIGMYRYEGRESIHVNGKEYVHISCDFKHVSDEHYLNAAQEGQYLSTKFTSIILSAFPEVGYLLRLFELDCEFRSPTDLRPDLSHSTLWDCLISSVWTSKPGLNIRKQRCTSAETARVLDVKKLSLSIPLVKYSNAGHWIYIDMSIIEILKLDFNLLPGNAQYVITRVAKKEFFKGVFPDSYFHTPLNEIELTIAVSKLYDRKLRAIKNRSRRFGVRNAHETLSIINK